MAERRRSPGRTSKLTPELERVIAGAVSAGVPLPRAAVLAGVDGSTALEWVARGEGRHPRRPVTKRYADFAAAIQKARAQDEARRIGRLNKAAEGGAVVLEKTTTYPDGRTITEVRRTEPQWTADAWYLERSRPEDWGRKDRIDLRLTITRAAEKVAEETGMTPEEVLQEAEELLRELDHADT